MSRACGSQALEIRYEDFLSNPQTSLSQLARFCGLQPTPGDIAALTGTIDSSRAFAHRSSPDLLAFNQEHAQTLKAFGY